MPEKLVKLYNTLKLVSTKGEDTKVMANCLAYLEQMIAEAQAKQVEPATPVEE